ncbi:tail fiber assembly protein [Yersinia aldovae]|uniref:tail fiber assembly protein n=1 Tax=Yersinia aldovae TaxID=29483 RepID=UPI003703DAED
MNTEMTAMFSASALAFYPQNMIDDGSYGDNLPDDLIELTVLELTEYWKRTPPTGKKLGSKKGRPVWGDLPPLTNEELVSLANAQKSQLRAVADSEIAWRQDAVDGGYARDKENTDLAAWKKYRVLLMRVDTSTAPDIDWPVAPE